MTSLYCVILAGGTGSRLWPLSREMFPKQMLKVNNDYSLFQQTFLNFASFVDDKNIITAANIKHISVIKEQLKFIQEKFCRRNEYKVLAEPISKNTAPALAMAVKYIKDELNFSTEMPLILTVPSDQIIASREQFACNIEKGIKLAKSGYIVSFGSKTSNVNEDFGYIKTGKNSKISEIEPSALKIAKFIEKPDLKQQKENLKGEIFLNSGIYMFSADVFFSELKKYAPEIFKIISNITIKNTIPSIPLDEYEKMPDISIDYAIMEKSKKLAVVPLDTEWKDIGSWNAIYDISKKDKNGNCFFGKIIDIGSSNSMLYSTSKIIAGIALKDMLVAETEDAVMVCDKKDLNGVKKIYKKLNGKNSEKKEIHKTVFRPWGCYTVLENGSGFLTKCITVNPNAKLSVQLHHHRSEHWIVLEGEALVLKGNETFKLQSGQSIDIETKEIHSLQNTGKVQLKVIEVQLGEILDENDIVRLEDIYGRV